MTVKLFNMSSYIDIAIAITSKCAIVASCITVQKYNWLIAMLKLLIRLCSCYIHH